VGAAMIVSMFHQQLLLHYAAKMYEGRRLAITNITCYYWAWALALWQRISFYQPVGGWFWNCPCNRHFASRFMLFWLLGYHLPVFLPLLWLLMFCVYSRAFTPAKI
jgi:hypothetical protein